MNASRSREFASGAPARGRSLVHLLVLGMVWLTFAVSGIVFGEPAPYDVLMLGLIVVLPLVRLADMTRLLATQLVLWIAVVAGAYIATTQAYFVDVGTQHATVSLFLGLSAVAVSAFVLVDPERHTRLILSGYTVAAVIAVLAAIVGYFQLVPGTYELFTKFSRARGTFEDPNVFAPFIIPILVLAMHRMIWGGFRAILSGGALFAFLLVGVMISFSRGAWFNLVLALMVYGYLSFVTVSTNRRRIKLVLFAFVGAGAIALVVAAALQVEGIAELYSERASLSLGYDAGPEGRFGGQIKALNVIMNHLLGVGPLEFGRFYHHEDAHNVYLTLFLDAGWLGGFAFLALIVSTLVMGLHQSLLPTPTQGYAIVLTASLVGLCGESFVIDTYHWRHLAVLMGMVWGLRAAHQRMRFREARALRFAPA